MGSIALHDYISQINNGRVPMVDDIKKDYNYTPSKQIADAREKVASNGERLRIAWPEKDGAIKIQNG